MPMVVVLAIRLRRPTSQLLLPLAFGAHAGSMLTLTGTPVNVIVNASAENAGVESFGFFEFALVGVPLVAGTIAIVVLFGERLLPHRNGEAIPPDLSAHARTLASEYRLDADPSTLVTRSRGHRRGRRLAALGSRRRDRLPRHGDRQRRLRRARSAAARRGRSRRPRSSRSATRCCCAGRGGRSRRASRATPTCWSSIRRSWCVARACPSERARSAPSPCSPAWCSCSRPEPSSPSSPDCSRRARSSSSACSTWIRPIARCHGRRSCSSRA